MSESISGIRKTKIGKELFEAILKITDKYGSFKKSLTEIEFAQFYFDVFDTVETIMVDNEFGNCRTCDRVDPESAGEKEYCKNEGWD